MTVTINDMKLVHADTLKPDQLMEGDIIRVDDEYFTIKSIAANSEGITVVLIDDFDESLETFIFDDEQIELYVFVE